MLRLRNNLSIRKPVVLLTLFCFCTYAILCNTCLSYAMDENLLHYASFKSIQERVDSGIKTSQIETDNTLSNKGHLNLYEGLETKLPLLAQATSYKDESEEEIRIFEEEEAIRRERELKALNAQAQIATGTTLQTVGILLGGGIAVVGTAYFTARGDDPVSGKIIMSAGCIAAGLLIGVPIYSSGSEMKKKAKEVVLSIDPSDNSVMLAYQYRF